MLCSLDLISLIYSIENTTKNLLSIAKRKITVNLCLAAGFQTYETKNSREITVDVITFNKLRLLSQVLYFRFNRPQEIIDYRLSLVDP